MRLFLVLALIVAGLYHDLCPIQSKQIITTGANPTLPFSAAVKADGLIYVAGTLGTDAAARSPRATSRRRRSRRSTTSPRRSRPPDRASPTPRA